MAWNRLVKVPIFLFTFILSWMALTAAAEAPKQDSGWDSWKFLMGEWIGEGSGTPGQGAGGFTFATDLQGKVLVRRNHADYAATADRPAYSHEDLMIVYQEPSQPVRAVYFDNEGHVIHYEVTVAKEGNAVTFLSEASATAPRFRFSYVETAPGALAIKFEIAPPGKPDSFSTYIEASARRKQ